MPDVRAGHADHHVVALAAYRDVLDAQYDAFNREDSAADPVHLVRRFSDPRDLEVAGFCAAALAFGRVASVLHSIERLFAVLGPSPHAFVRAFDPPRHPELRPLVHRWVTGKDLAALLLVLRRMLEQSGSLESFFLEEDPDGHADIGPALDSFCRRALAFDLTAIYGTRRARIGICHFFPRPSAGSACKRLNLFLRWMVRRDAVDLGVWSRVRAARLVVPLDTHVIRLGRCLGLTRRSTPGWKMAVEITEGLRALSPEDPVRYDFSLCHIGMAGMCGYGTRRGNRDCPLKGVCRPKRSPGARWPARTRSARQSPSARR
ncbi:MAG TPA: TIGR02757 family protein [Vicinamibacterales bacterium]|nr:TIGR02757 family protein [Vicinamibacterales bacterium]